MINNLKNKKKGKGFTLIELIIVIAIIAIISAIAIPKLLNSRDQANRTADVASAKTIANAAATAIVNNNLIVPTGGIAANEVIVADPVVTSGNIVAAALQNVPTPRTVTANRFFITITEDAQITVTIATTTGTNPVEAFPTPDANNLG